MRKLSVLIAAGALAASTSIALAADLNLTFGPGRDATQPGTVSIQDMGTSFKVTINMTAPSPAGADATQPAHIHEGTCPGVGRVDVPLTNVVGGKSETTVTRSLASVLATPHSINVHKSTSEAGVYTACINLPVMAASAAPAQLPRTGGVDLGLLAALGAGFAGVGTVLRRR